jgi:hypothetical protein
VRFADLLKRDGETPAALVEAMDRARQAHAAAEAALERLGDERTKALLADDERRLDAVESEITKGTRDRDRARLAGTELSRRLAIAQQRERDERLDGIYTAGTKAQEKAAAIIKGRYRKLAMEMANLAQELEALDGEIAEANRTLTVENDPRRVADVDTVARPQKPGVIPMLGVGIAAGLRLPDPSDCTRFLWPAGDVTSATYVPPAQRGLAQVLAGGGVQREVVTLKKPHGEAA